MNNRLFNRTIALAILALAVFLTLYPVAWMMSHP